ncbi:MAG: hypothetical protein FJY07_02210 [Bacteroidetes bacterium]|nr:hypothetical protein [Chloroflexota bacterium]MBM3435012.1 hypothetical protein [Bacteroidota bacterium]
MIERYNLNLARDITASSRVRKKCYFLMVLYLVLSGAVLIEGAHHVAERIAQVRSAELDSKDLREQFSMKTGGIFSPEDYVKELMKRIERQNATIKILQDQSKRSIPFLPVLFEVQNTLPESVILSKFEMTTNQLNVTFHFPDTAERPEVYLQKWRGSVAMAKYLEELEVIGRVSGVELNGETAKMTELSCSATLK